MTDYTVCISTSEYAELVEARHERDIIKDAVERDGHKFSQLEYNTCNVIDAVLGIERKEETA